MQNTEAIKTDQSGDGDRCDPDNPSLYGVAFEACRVSRGYESGHLKSGPEGERMWFGGMPIGWALRGCGAGARCEAQAHDRHDPSAAWCEVCEGPCELFDVAAFTRDTERPGSTRAAVAEAAQALHEPTKDDLLNHALGLAWIYQLIAESVVVDDLHVARELFAELEDTAQVEARGRYVRRLESVGPWARLIRSGDGDRASGLAIGRAALAMHHVNESRRDSADKRHWDTLTEPEKEVRNDLALAAYVAILRHAKQLEERDDRARAECIWCNTPGQVGECERCGGQIERHVRTARRSDSSAHGRALAAGILLQRAAEWGAIRANPLAEELRFLAAIVAGNPAEWGKLSDDDLRPIAWVHVQAVAWKGWRAHPRAGSKYEMTEEENKGEAFWEGFEKEFGAAARQQAQGWREAEDPDERQKRDEEADQNARDERAYLKWKEARDRGEAWSAMDAPIIAPALTLGEALDLTKRALVESLAKVAEENAERRRAAPIMPRPDAVVVTCGSEHASGRVCELKKGHDHAGADAFDQWHVAGEVRWYLPTGSLFGLKGALVEAITCGAEHASGLECERRPNHKEAQHGAGRVGWLNPEGPTYYADTWRIMATAPGQTPVRDIPAWTRVHATTNDQVTKPLTTEQRSSNMAADEKTPESGGTLPGVGNHILSTSDKLCVSDVVSAKKKACRTQDEKGFDPASNSTGQNAGYETGRTGVDRTGKGSWTAAVFVQWFVQWLQTHTMVHTVWAQVAIAGVMRLGETRAGESKERTDPTFRDDAAREMLGQIADMAARRGGMELERTAGEMPTEGVGPEMHAADRCAGWAMRAAGEFALVARAIAEERSIEGVQERARACVVCCMRAALWGKMLAALTDEKGVPLPQHYALLLHIYEEKIAKEAEELRDALEVIGANHE